MPTPLTDEELFCLQDCQTYPQYWRMRQAFENGICPFCEVDRTYNRILFEDDHVLAWAVPGQIKRKELAVQLLVVPKRHARFEWDLPASEWMSMRTALRFMAAHYDLAGGMSFTRFGNMSLNAGTVAHLHKNIWVPNGFGEVRIPIFKDPTHQERNRERAGWFSDRYEHGEVPV